VAREKGKKGLAKKRGKNKNSELSLETPSSGGRTFPKAEKKRSRPEKPGREGSMAHGACLEKAPDPFSFFRGEEGGRISRIISKDSGNCVHTP